MKTARAVLIAEESNAVSGSSKSFAKKKAIAKSADAMLRRLRKELGDYLTEGS